jgi:hypothetical protein
MRSMIAIIVGLLTVVITAGNMKAWDPKSDEPYPVELRVGEIFKVCKSGVIYCPAGAAICDDLKIVEVVDTPDGMGFKAIAPGATLCSAKGSGMTLPRRVFRITVRGND